MRIIDAAEIKNCVRELFVSANVFLPTDIKNRLCECRSQEAGISCDAMGDMIKNFGEAERLGIPVCQDTGMAVVFIKLGQRVCVNGDLMAAVDAGVAEGYLAGHLRASVVSDPLRRINSGDNTPAVVHIEIEDSDRIEICVAPKGFGSENMSAVRMFTPSAGHRDIIAFVADTVRAAGACPCPPVVVGVGIGGTFEQCALLAKKALIRDIGLRNADELYSGLEQSMLEAINALGIGPQGFGGVNTALAVNIEFAATHIAGLPVAVNMGCHVNRHATRII